MFAVDDVAPISPGSVFATFAILDTLVVSPRQETKILLS